MWSSHPNLVTLDLAANGFEGTLPATFSLPALLDLDLGENGLTGAIPSGISTLGTQLTGLDLHANNLGGVDELDAAAAIPAEIEQLTGLVGPGSLQLRDNECFTAAGTTLTFVSSRDTLWNNGCPVGP
jgi:hypothetical protein